MQKNFLLCVGSQKCGTTWLHKYLNRHPNTNLGFAKEYHVFDALYIPACSYIIENRMKEANKLYEQGIFPFKEKSLVFRLLDFCGNPQNYFEYFQTLVNCSKDIFLTGDITPSYSGLPTEALQMIKSELEKRDFKVKVVFIMRDPVDRCISAGRMFFKLRGLTATAEEENKVLKEIYNSEEFHIRTNYHKTISNLESVFSADQIAYFFYETFFDTKTIQYLTNFLSIPFHLPDFSYNPNSSRSENKIDESLKREIFQNYSHVYEFIEKRFGAEPIKKWQHY